MRRLIFLFAATAFAEQPDVAKISEAIGHMIGKQLEHFGVDFDLDAIAKGLKESSEGKTAPLNEEDCIEAITMLQDEKITLTTQQILDQADAVSNGDILNENHSIPASNPAKHR